MSLKFEGGQLNRLEICTLQPKKLSVLMKCPKQRRKLRCTASNGIIIVVYPPFENPIDLLRANGCQLKHLWCRDLLSWLCQKLGYLSKGIGVMTSYSNKSELCNWVKKPLITWGHQRVNTNLIQMQYPLKQQKAVRSQSSVVRF